MKREILRKAVKLNIEHKRRKRWRKVMSGLAAVVVFVTTYALILPAITLESETVCGLTEHVHEDACRYTPVVDTAAELQCNVTAHAHEESCFDGDGKTVCGWGEYVIHVHDALCLDEAGELICRLPEVEEHIHEDGCFVEHTAYTCGLVAGENAHAHGEDCYGEAPLLCALLASEGHVHDESCGETTEYACGLELGANAHSHGEGCYGEAPLLCELSESAGHVHGEDCGPNVVRELVCGKKEVVSHIHEETCRDDSGLLICGMPQVPAHQHGESCFAEHKHGEACFQTEGENSVLICGIHVHGEECLDEKGERICGQPVLICGMTEHSHDESCYPPEEEPAGVETTVVILHDLDPYGVEYDQSPLELTVPAGSTLAEQSELLLWDGTAIPDCLWYTADGELFDMASPLSEGMELYTYSYVLRLDMGTQSPAPMLMTLSLEEEAETTEEEDAVSILKRDGALLTETDFIVEEENYGDYLWLDGAGNEVDTDDLVGTTLSANYDLVLAASTDYTIQYNINISQTVFGTVPQVGGASTLSDSYNSDEGDYIIRVPNPTSYMVASGNKKTLYQFTGWKISRTGSTIAAGETVDATWVANNVNRRTTRVVLTAQWSPVVVTETVHFFVNLNCQVADVDGNTGIPDSGQFTPSVFSTTMTVTGASMKNYWQGAINGSQYILFRADHANDTAVVDAEIRRLINGHDSTNDSYNGQTVWKTGYNGTKLFQVADFPSDEQVLSVVREMVANGTVIRMNGVALTEEELTTENFTVRWNVCKYDTGDGWHIDGVLVGKQAHMTVKKSFLGDEEAVQAVKEGGFSITVRNTSQTTAADTILTLNAQSEETQTNCIGYAAYDSASDTYTWNVPLQQDDLYAVIENNHISTDDSVQTASYYTISNSPEAFAGWQNYPTGGVEGIKAYAYANDVSTDGYQTVALRNAYVKADTLTINKIDMDTGNGMAGVSYRLTDITGEELALYQKPGASYYSMKAEDLQNGFEACSDSVITTDSNGAIFLKLDSGTFTLEEAFPTGYGGYSKITVTVGVDETGSVVFDEVHSSDSTIEVDGTLVDKNTATLTIRNVSVSTAVTAQKVWLQAADAQPVTVALYRNGVAMGSQYQAELTERNGWTYTWTDLPLYVDGAEARYSLREIKIGSVNHDPSADTDGYSAYIVVYDDMAYYKNGEAVSAPVWVDDNGVTQYADEARLVVRNEVYRGQLMFLKVDGDGNPLSGAVFRLYRDEDQTQLLAEAVSDEYGRVIFSNLMPDTYYVMKETGTPDGYVGADSQYKVRLSSRGTTTVEDTDTGQAVTAIVNYADEAELKLIKISDYGAALTGAVFRLERLETDVWTNLGTYETGTGGLISFGSLSAGSYRLTEEKPPDGFTVLEESIAFTVQNRAVTPDGSGSLWSLAYDDGTGAYVITVTNRTGYELPQAGGPGAQAYTYGGLLLVLSATVLLAHRKKHRKGVDSS